MIDDWEVGGATRQSGGNWKGRFILPENFAAWYVTNGRYLEQGQMVTIGDALLKWDGSAFKIIDATFADQPTADAWMAKIGAPIATNSTATITGTLVRYGGAGAGWVEDGEINAHTDVTYLPDGPLPQKHQGMELPIDSLYPTGYNSIPLIVKDGRIQSESSNPAISTTCYTETDLKGEATILGADISFKDAGGSQSGLCAVIVWGESLLAKYYNGGIPRSGCHVIVSRDYWAYQVFEEGNGGASALLYESKMPPIPLDQSLFRIVIKFDGDSAIVEFPSIGYSKKITDSRIRTLGRRYACWETVQQTGTHHKPQFGRIWAKVSDKAEIASNFSEVLAKTVAVQSATNGAKSITATTDTGAAEIDANTFVEFVMPPSGKVLLQYIVRINQTIAGTLLFDMYVSDAANTVGSFNLAQPTAGLVGNNLYNISFVFKSTQPSHIGALCVFRPRAWISGGVAAAQIIRDVGGGINPVLIVSPLP